MPQYAYPFDPHGSNPENFIQNEVTTLVRDNRLYRLIVPEFAPFFYRDFEIKLGETVLEEGVHYYLTNRFKVGSHITAQDLFGSIWIIDSELSGQFSYTYRTVGDTHTATREQANAYIESQADPVSGTWEDIKGGDYYFPPVALNFDRENWSGEQELIGELDRLAQAVGSRDMTEDDMYQYVKDWADALQLLVDSSDFQIHVNADTNVHGVEWYQADALKSDGIAANAALLYGMTIGNLTTYINERGITAADLTPYLNRFENNVMTGNIQLVDGKGFITLGEDGSDDTLTTMVDFSANVWKLYTELGIRYVADVDQTGNAELSIQAGNNVLTLISNGTDRTGSPLLLNGAPVLTRNNLGEYVAGGSVQADISVRSTATVRLFGNGSTANPLRLEMVIPEATASNYGMAVIDVSRTSRSATKFAAPVLLKEIKERLDNKVPLDRTINGYDLRYDILIQKSDIGLENVENLPDVDMPVNANHTDLTVELIPKEHVHGWEDLGFEKATETVKGVVAFTEDPTVVEEGYCIPSAVVANHYRIGDNLRRSVDNALPGDALNMQQFGGVGYLPVPVSGSYEGCGTLIDSTFNYAPAEREGNGDIVFLRNGVDALGSGIYYTIVKADSQNKISEYRPTTTKYEPPYLPAGVTAVAVSAFSPGIFILRGSDGNDYLVLTRGTMDSTKHHGVKINNANNVFTDYRYSRPVIVGEYIYIVRTDLSSQQGWWLELYRISIAGVERLAEVSLEKVGLTSVGVGGLAGDGTTVILGNPESPFGSDDPNAVSNLKTARWTGTRNLRNNGLNYELAENDGQLRVLYYFRQNYTDGDGGYMFNMYAAASCVVDTASNTVTLDSNEMPIQINDGTVVGHQVNLSNLPKEASHNDTAFLKFDNLYLTTTYAAGDATLYTSTAPAVSSHFDALLWNQLNVFPDEAGVAMTGSFGGPTGQSFSGFLMLNPTTAAIRNLVETNGHKAALVSIDPNGAYGSYEGYGPGPERTGITTDKLADICRTGYVTNADGSNVSAAATLHRGELTTPETVNVDGTVSGGFSITDAILDQIEARLTPHISGTVLDKIPFVVTAATQADPLAMLWYITDDGGVRKVGFVYEKFVADNRVTIRVIQSWAGNQNVWESAGIWNDSFNREWLTATAYTTAVAVNGTTYYIPGVVPTVRRVTTDITWAVAIGIEGNVVRMIRVGANNRPTIAAYGWLPEYGLVRFKHEHESTSIVADVYGKTYQEISTGVKKTVMVFSSIVADSWSVYITEPQQYIVGATKHLLDVTDFNLKALFPDTHRNNTFHFYVGLDNYGVANYSVLNSRVVDSDTSVWIGYCKTDNNGIVELSIGRVTRLGKFRELEEHLDDPRAHGFDPDTISKDLVGLGQLENRGSKDDLVYPTFKDVFNNWKRISHNGTAQPANPSELDTWTYNEARDSVENTTNSSSLVGMVSTETVGDYEFETIVSSTNADDDFIGLCLAFVEEGGREHTITAMASGTDTRQTVYAIYYNYAQGESYGQEVLASYNMPSTFNHGWDTLGKCRITATRVGDILTVTFGGFTGQPSVPARTLTIDLSTNAKLHKFRRSVRFGYVAHSQANSTWENVVRPDEIGSAYYGTRNLLESMYDGAKRFTAIHGSVVVVADGSSKVTIPVPAGYTSSDCIVSVRPAHQSDSFGGWDLSHVQVKGVGNSFELVAAGFSTNRANNIRFAYSVVADEILRKRRVG